MSRPNGIIFGVACALVAASCAASKKDIESAKHSQYDTDFAIVYSAALDVTRDLYPNMDESPGRGAIRTSWHQVQYAVNNDDLVNPISMQNGTGTGANALGGMAGQTAGATAAGMPSRGPIGKKYFIRFDVTVAGGRPWRVKVVGHASEWEPGAAMPVEMHGIARPPWLEGRTDALQLAIYNKIKPYAIRMKEEVKTVAEDDLPHADPATFKDVPPPAAKRLALLEDACSHRDYAALRPQVADDVVWSLGADPSADGAMAMWQADPDTLDTMAHLVVAGCTAAGDKRVTCPGGSPAKNAYQLVLELRADGWKLASFVKAE